MKKLFLLAILLIAGGCHYDNLVNIDLRKVECDCVKQKHQTSAQATQPADETPADLFGRYLLK